MVFPTLIKPAALVALLTAPSALAYRLGDDVESNLERKLAPGAVLPGIMGDQSINNLGDSEVDILNIAGTKDSELETFQRPPGAPGGPGGPGGASDPVTIVVNPRPVRLPPNTIVIKPSLIAFEKCKVYTNQLKLAIPSYPSIRNLKCEQACWTENLCPDDCLKHEQLEDWCASIFYDLSNLLAVSKVCEVCTFQCREYCLTYTQFCCPCKGNDEYKRYALEIEPDKDSCKEFFVKEPFTFNDTTPVLLGGTKYWQGPDIYGGFQSYTKGSSYWYSGKFKHASPGLGIGYGNGPATGEASALFLWRQDDFSNDLDFGPVRWLHTPSSSRSEDRVRYRGDNYYCSDVCDHSIDSKFRVVFQDSGGWHISKTTKDTAKGLRSIYMADPDRDYRRFDPYINDVNQVEAGYTYKDSCPTFTCIQWVGFRIDTERKCSHKWYSGKKDDCALSVVEEFTVKGKGTTLRTDDVPRLQGQGRPRAN